jgi:hypothetical protein
MIAVEVGDGQIGLPGIVWWMRSMNASDTAELPALLSYGTSPSDPKRPGASTATT